MKRYIFILVFNILCFGSFAQNTETKYRIIVGSFLVEQNAQNWAKKFQNLGYSAKIVKAPGLPYNRVCIHEVDTKLQAMEMYRALLYKKVVPNDGWVFIDSVNYRNGVEITYNNTSPNTSNNTNNTSLNTSPNSYTTTPYNTRANTNNDISDNISGTVENPDLLLFKAVTKGDLDLLDKIIASGVDLNQKDKDGLTPLLIASFFNNYDVCQTLILAGADINVTDRSGFTPLLVASYLNYFDLCKLFVKAGADKKKRNINNMTALDVARGLRYDNIVSLLSEN